MELLRSSLRRNFEGKVVVGVGKCHQFPQAISDPSIDFVSFCLMLSVVRELGKGLYDRSLPGESKNDMDSF